jgi:hypothetical protein
MRPLLINSAQGCLFVGAFIRPQRRFGQATDHGRSFTSYWTSGGQQRNRQQRSHFHSARVQHWWSTDAETVTWTPAMKAQYGKYQRLIDLHG